MKRRLAYPILLCLLAISVNVLSFSSWLSKPLDGVLATSLSLYAVARGLNASLSVAQGTELSIEPMGVGVTLAPGEILDPLNDLVEQLSWVLLSAAASVAMQSLLLELGDLFWLQAGLVAIALVLMLTLCIKRDLMHHRAWRLLIRILVVLTLLRLAVPGMALITKASEDWLQERRENQIEVLGDTKTRVEGLQQHSQQAQAKNSWFSGLLDNVSEHVDISTRLKHIEERAEEAVTAAIYLLAQCFVQFLVLPLVFLWLLKALLAQLLRPFAPVRLEHTGPPLTTAPGPDTPSRV